MYYVLMVKLIIYYSHWSKIGINIEVSTQDIWNINSIPVILNDYKNVEGVYIIITNDRISDKVNDFLEKLDLKTRNLNPKLR